MKSRNKMIRHATLIITILLSGIHMHSQMQSEMDNKQAADEYSKLEQVKNEVIYQFNPEDPFTFGDYVVHPFALRKFDCWISDTDPNVASIILPYSLNNSNEYFDEVTIRSSNGRQSSDYDTGEGYFYEVLGRMDNGLYVVHTVDITTGTARFHDVKILELGEILYKESNVGIHNLPILILRSNIWLNQKFRGDISIEGNTVIIYDFELNDEAVIFSFEDLLQTQMEIELDSKQADEGFKLADKELNNLYQQILVEYKSDTLFINKLRASQRIWMQFRDTELAMKYPEMETGDSSTFSPKCSSSYLAELTKTRTETLKTWLTGYDLSNESNTCSGSVKSNFSDDNKIDELSQEEIDAFVDAVTNIFTWRIEEQDNGTYLVIDMPYSSDDNNPIEYLTVAVKKEISMERPDAVIIVIPNDVIKLSEVFISFANEYANNGVRSFKFENENPVKLGFEDCNDKDCFVRMLDGYIIRQSTNEKQDIYQKFLDYDYVNLLLVYTDGSHKSIRIPLSSFQKQITKM